MSHGRPRTVMGTFGQVHLTDLGGRYRALTRFRDTDGRLRKVTATARSQRAVEALLKERLLTRSGYGTGGLLSMSSPFGDLVELWLADLELRGISENTKDNYRDDLRLHVRPFFEHFTLGEITTLAAGDNRNVSTARLPLLRSAGSAPSRLHPARRTAAGSTAAAIDRPTLPSTRSPSLACAGTNARRTTSNDASPRATRRGAIRCLKRYIAGEIYRELNWTMSTPPTAQSAPRHP